MGALETGPEGMLRKMSDNSIISTQIQDYRSFNGPEALRVAKECSDKWNLLPLYVFQERASMKPSVILVLFGASDDLLVRILQFNAVRTLVTNVGRKCQLA